MEEHASGRGLRWLSAPAALAYCACAEQLYKIAGGPPGVPAVAAELASYLFLASVALWVVADARRRDWPLPYDYASFVFIFWPLFALVYVISARGRRAFSPIVWSFLLAAAGVIAAYMIAGIAYLIRGDANI